MPHHHFLLYGRTSALLVSMDDAQWFSHHMAYHVPCVGNPVLPHRIMTTPTTFFSNSNNDYLTDFEWLVNRIIGLALPFLLSCFISGLNPELHKVSSPVADVPAIGGGSSQALGRQA